MNKHRPRRPVGQPRPLHHQEERLGERRLVAHHPVCRRPAGHRRLEGWVVRRAWVALRWEAHLGDSKDR